MRRFEIGEVYNAHLHKNEIRVKRPGSYHFKILDIVFDYQVKPKFILAVKLGMDDYSDPQPYILSFNMMGIGYFSDTNFVFTLKRKIPHKNGYALIQKPRTQ
jgi:hypothetical protein